MNKSNKKCLKISIEGNISSGKSSIINYLKKKIDSSTAQNELIDKIILGDETNYRGIVACSKAAFISPTKRHPLDFLRQPNVHLKVLTEPVHLWRNLNGNNLLDLMYTDPHTWAFPFHSYVQLTMLQHHLELSDVANGSICGENQFKSDDLYVNIMERSLYSAKYCFVENLYRCQFLQRVHYDIYEKWFKWMTSAHDCSLDIIFYLRTDPHICMSRIHQRGRPEETQSVGLDYLLKIHDLHEAWLSPSVYGSENNGLFYRPPTVITINGDQPLDDVYKIIERETRNVATLASC